VVESGERIEPDALVLAVERLGEVGAAALALAG
jgi:hypothetical protein